MSESDLRAWVTVIFSVALVLFVCFASWQPGSHPCHDARCPQKLRREDQTRRD